MIFHREDKKSNVDHERCPEGSFKQQYYNKSVFLCNFRAMRNLILFVAKQKGKGIYN